MKRMMREELAERVETAFDEEYSWPLAFAVVLLIIEGLVPEAPLPRLAFAGAMSSAMTTALGVKKPKKKRPTRKKSGDVQAKKRRAA